MKPKVIKSPEEHERALARVAALMERSPDQEEEAELELWGVLIEKFEEEHFPIPKPDPVSAILFRMEQQGLTRGDLEKIIRHKSRVSEVLSRKRPLSANMIRAFHEGLKIPAEVLIQPISIRRIRKRSKRVGAAGISKRITR